MVHSTGLPKNIALITYEYIPFPGGIATYAHGLVTALRDKDVTPLVIAPYYPDLPKDHGEVRTIRPLRHHRQSLSAMWHVFDLLRKTPKETIVLAADLRSIVLVHALTRVVPRRYIAMVHGSEASKFRSSSLLFRVLRRAYLGADKVVFNSRATANIFHAAIGKPTLEAVTYLGVEDSWFVRDEQPFEHEALLALSLNDKVICSVGRIEPRKGQSDAIRAISVAQRKLGLQNCVYVVAGKVEDGDYAAELRRLSEELGVRLVLTGRLSPDDLRRLYRRSACHTLLAKELEGKIEGFGLVLLEAGAQGCPSVAAAVGGIPEVLDEVGTLIEPGDIHAAASAYVSYIDQDEYRLEQGRKIRARAEKFTWSACAAETFLFSSEGENLDRRFSDAAE